MKIRRSLILGSAITGLLVAVAAPASADDTDTTFTLSGGALTLSVQATAALTDGGTGDLLVTGSLGATSVSDLRGGTATWEVSAASSAFTGPLGSSSTAVSYTAGAVTETGSITVADGGATTLTLSPVPVVDPSAQSGNNTASWAPTLDVTMPASALADDYAGTVVTSVL